MLMIEILPIENLEGLSCGPKVFLFCDGSLKIQGLLKIHVQQQGPKRSYAKQMTSYLIQGVERI